MYSSSNYFYCCSKDNRCIVFHRKILTYEDDLKEFFLKYSIEFIKGSTRKISEAISINYQPLKFKLSAEQYSIFYSQFVSKDNLCIIPIDRHYELLDEIKLVNNVIVKGCNMAKGIIKKKGGSILDLIKIEKKESHSGWTIYPPPSANMNYFETYIGGDFKLSFNASYF